MRRYFVHMVVLGMLVGVVGTAQAGRPVAGRCWTVPGSATLGQTVEIWGDGLPTKTALNVFVTDTDGTWGFPVGAHVTGAVEGVWYTADALGTTTIKITGPERGNTKIYATCAMEVGAS